MNCTNPPSGSLCTVDIIFLRESNGASPILSYVSLRIPFGIPFIAASVTRAHSVASPTALSVSHSASQQRAIPITSIRPSSEGISFFSSPPVLKEPSFTFTCSTTVILFCVSVPVLSEQMIWVQPRVSTAVSFLMIACFCDIRVTPSERSTVTTAASPSGIAATASDIAIMKVSRKNAPEIPLPVTRFLTIFNPKMAIHITITIIERIFESSFSFI